MAALLMGNVRVTPTITERTIPMIRGCFSVAYWIKMPTEESASPIRFAVSMDKPAPVKP